MKIKIASLAIISVLSGVSANAINSTYTQAVSDYNAGKYAKALSEFAALRAAYPNNELVHYYSALTMQQMGQLAGARAEFGIVTNGNDGRLRAMAQAGLAQLSQARGSSATSSTTRVGAVTASAGSSSSPKIRRVLEFFADWCGPCHQFEPTYMNVSSHMSGVQFTRYNVDEAEGKELEAKYDIHSIPHVVFLDAHDNVLYNGLPNFEVESFTAQINKYK